MPLRILVPVLVLLMMLCPVLAAERVSEQSIGSLAHAVAHE